MSKFKDLTGNKYNYLTAIRVLKKNNGRAIWLFKCDCGKELELKGAIVTRKTKPQKSCNECYQKRRILHGMSKSKEFYAWRGILNRCTNKNEVSYKHYGGRGIKVCDRWNEFKNFIDDMGYSPSKKHSIDRINNNDGYYKENCRWATTKQQMRNVRSNRIIEYNGESKPISEWAEDLGLTYQALFYRLKRNWDLEKAFTYPHQKRKTKNDIHHSNNI